MVCAGTPRSLNVDGNQLSGPIDVLMQLTSLAYLEVYRNAFTGTIPSTIGTLAKLTYVAAYVPGYQVVAVAAPSLMFGCNCFPCAQPH